jgi:hypothetical protein
LSVITETGFAGFSDLPWSLVGTGWHPEMAMIDQIENRMDLIVCIVAVLGAGAQYCSTEMHHYDSPEARDSGFVAPPVLNTRNFERNLNSLQSSHASLSSRVGSSGFAFAGKRNLQKVNPRVYFTTEVRKVNRKVYNFFKRLTWNANRELG